MTFYRNSVKRLFQNTIKALVLNVLCKSTLKIEIAAVMGTEMEGLPLEKMDMP